MLTKDTIKISIAPIVILLSLILLRWNNGVLLFHTMAELFSVVVGILMLVVALNTRHYSQNNFLIYLGIGYFWIAILDGMHTFTVPGMPFFNLTDAEVTLHFWVYTRIFEAFLVLSAPLFLKKSLNIYWMFGLCAGIALLIGWASFKLPQPSMLTSHGLTTIKVFIEYFVIALLLLSISIYISMRRVFSHKILIYILSSISLTIGSEICFTLYNNFYGVPFVVGHLFKFLSFWMIYQAIIVTTLKEPFSVLAQTSSSYDAIPHIAVVVDQQGKILQLNRFAKKYVGKTDVSILQQHVHDYFHPQIAGKENCELCEHIRSIKPMASRRFYFPDKKRWFSFSLAPVTTGNNQFSMVQTSTDVTDQVVASEKLEASEQLLKTVINATPDWIFIKDRKFRYLFVNEGYARALNLRPEDFYGKTDIEMGFSKELVYGNESRGIRGFRADDQMVIQGKTLTNPYDPATFSDGSYHIFDTYKTPLYDSSGKVYALLGIAREVTERQELETKLHQAATVYDSTTEGIMITDAQVRIIAVNKAFSKITGYSEDEVIGKTPNYISSGEHNCEFYQKLWNDLKNKGHWQGELINRHHDGHLYTEWKIISVVKNADGRVTNYVATFSDITDLKISQEEMKRMAQHDQLTGLPNRTLLSEELEQAISRARRSQKTSQETRVAIMFLDLDNFKQINDTLGHSFGDKVLKEVAQKFKACIREEDILSRQGGDEFLVILEKLKDAKEAAIVAQKLINSLQQPFLISGHEFYIGVSIGISIFPDDGQEPEVLIKNADTAMYQSKNNRKNQYSYFTKSMNESSRRRFELENNLRSALERNEIYVVYQPQIDLKSNRIYGFEALVRWENQDIGLISPAEFIPVAESIGVIDEIGLYVLQQAVKHIKKWNKEFRNDMSVSVNISSRQFENRRLPETIKNVLLEQNCASELLKIEITESLLLQESTHVLESLQAIARLGVAIALDDFGTGYSSLSYLKRFPIDIVKIDQSFVRDMTSDAEDAILVKTIISMARGLKMNTIAEGVETIEQLTFLQVEECHLIQGYYFSKPLNAEDVEHFLSRWLEKNHYQELAPGANDLAT